MIRMEWNKIFIRQKGLVYLAVILLLKIVSIIVAGYDSNYMIDENESYYLAYIEQYEGKITEETQKSIEEEYDRIYHEDDMDYLSTSKEKAFQVIFHQYTYQKEDGGGYLLDPRGWQSILEHDDVDYLLLIGLIITATLLFAAEYDTDMQALLLTSRKGKYQSTLIKLFLGIAAGMVLSTVFWLMKYLYLYATVGLPHGNYPLTCLEYFEGTTWECSLWQACLYVSVFRILGAVFVSLFAMTAVILLRRTVISMIVSSFVWLLADVFLGQGSIGYYTPIGLLRASGYLWASQYASAVDDDGSMIKICTFQALSWRQLTASLLLFAFLMCLLFLAGFLVFSKPPLKLPFRKRGMAMCGLICLVPFLFTGCGASDGEAERIVVGETSQNAYSCGEYQLKIDPDSNNIIYTTDSGEEYALIRDVFPRDDKIACVFVSGNFCYYLMENGSDTGIYIRRIDLDTLSDEFVFSDMEENAEDLYGLLYEEKSVEEIFEDLDHTEWFFVTDRSIYLKKKNTISRIDRITGYHRIIAEQVSDEAVTYQDGVLSYTDFYGKTIDVEEK